MKFLGGTLEKLLQGAISLKMDFDNLRVELKNKPVNGSSGGGMVNVEANSLFEVLKIDIEQGLFEKGDKRMLEDLVCSAVNDAMKKSETNALDALKTVMQKSGVPFDVSTLYK